jgi:hypothetical protein
MRKVSVFTRNGCPFYSGIGVRFAPEWVSVLKQNGCPLCSGTPVRITPEWVSVLTRILHKGYRKNLARRKG